MYIRMTHTHSHIDTRSICDTSIFTDARTHPQIYTRSNFDMYTYTDARTQSHIDTPSTNDTYTLFTNPHTLYLRHIQNNHTQMHIHIDTPSTDDTYTPLTNSHALYLQHVQNTKFTHILFSTRAHPQIHIHTHKFTHVLFATHTHSLLLDTLTDTARSVEDETRNARRSAKRHPEWSSQVSFQTAHLKRDTNFDHRGFR